MTKRLQKECDNIALLLDIMTITDEMVECYKKYIKEVENINEPLEIQDHPIYHSKEQMDIWDDYKKSIESEINKRKKFRIKKNKCFTNKCICKFSAIQAVTYILEKYSKIEAIPLYYYHKTNEIRNCDFCEGGLTPDCYTFNYGQVDYFCCHEKCQFAHSNFIERCESCSVEFVTNNDIIDPKGTEEVNILCCDCR